MNSIQVTGHVTSTWRYGEDRFVRLAVGRGPALPSKMEDEDKDGKLVRRDSDYISVRLPARLFGGVPVDFKKGQHLEVVGFLQSRDYFETLTTYLKRAQGNMQLPDDFDPSTIRRKRSAVEIVALSVVRLEKGHQWVYVVDKEPLLDNAPTQPAQ